MRNRKPNWWLLYLAVPLVLGSLVVESQMPYSLVMHRIAEFAIVLLGFGLMFVWVHANEGGLIDEEIEKERWTIISNPAKGTINRALRSSSDGCDDSGEGHHRPEASPTKGRYN